MKRIHSQAILLASLIGLAICPAAAALAQQEPAARIASLVMRLNDDSFHAREHAQQALIEAGPLAEEHLQQALASESPEVRQRAENILRRRRFHAVWKPTSHEYDSRKVPFGEVLGHYRQAMGVQAMTLNAYGVDTNVDVRLPRKEMGALEAMATAADQIGCSIREPYDHFFRDTYPSIKLGPCRSIVGRAFNGPMMLELFSARQDPKTHELHLDFRLIWEPKFELVSHGGQPASFRFNWSNAKGDQSTINMPIQWHSTHSKAKPVRVTSIIELEEPIEKIEQLSIEWPACAAAKSGTVTFDKAEIGQTRVTEAGEMTLQRWEDNSIAVLVENIRSWPEPQEALLRCYQWEPYTANAPPFGNCELTQTGCRWRSGLYSKGVLGGKLHFAYRTEFSRRNLDFMFKKVEVSPMQSRTTALRGR